MLKIRLADEPRAAVRAAAIVTGGKAIESSTFDPRRASCSRVALPTPPTPSTMTSNAEFGMRSSLWNP